MASAPEAASKIELLPEPLALVGLLVAAVAAALLLPALAPHVPHPGTAEHAKYALTGAGVLALSTAYLFAVARRESLDRTWLVLTFAFGAGLVIVKFVLSPSAFSRVPGKSLGSFAAAGIIVMPLYIAALYGIYAIARRRSGGWSFTSKAVLAIGLAVVAVLTRFVASAALGTASRYTHDLSHGSALLLPAFVIVASLAVMGSFDRAGPALQTAFSVSVALVLIMHVTWVVYMYRLFS